MIVHETRKVHKSNYLQMFFKKGALKSFAIFTGKCLCWSLFLIKLQAYNFIKKRFQHRSFPMNIAKFLRKFYIKHFRSLLLVTAIIEDIQRNNYFKVASTTCLTIQFL